MSFIQPGEREREREREKIGTRKLANLIMLAPRQRKNNPTGETKLADTTTAITTAMAITNGGNGAITNDNDNSESSSVDDILSIGNGKHQSESNTTTTNSGLGPASSSSISTKSRSRNYCSIIGKNRKFFTLIVVMVAVSYYISVKERHVLLDESQYTDARKEYFKNTLNHHERYSSVDTYHRPAGPTGEFILNPANEFLPHIAWLMSFPNSGTSYTMTMVARSTNKSHATNYGDEVTPDDEPNSLSIYPRRPEGPFWPGMSGKLHTPRDLPDKYVITKTHCGARCVECGPDEYIETPFRFLKRCTLGHAQLTPAKKRRKYDVEYPPERVYKAIHLYRNPFHNVIARYHLEHRHKGPGYKNDKKWLADHTNDSNGLHQWCEDLRKNYKKNDIEFWGSAEKIPNKAPCHGEFYKWTQWHNLVHEGLDLITEHPVPIHTVYYEDYTSNLNTTADGILHFLELEQVAPYRVFTARSDYGGYFADQELQSIKTLIKSVANNRTWSDIQQYFVGIE